MIDIITLLIEGIIIGLLCAVIYYFTRNIFITILLGCIIYVGFNKKA